MTNAYQAVVEQLPWGVPFTHVTDPATGWGTNQAGTGWLQVQGWRGNQYPWQLGYGAIGCLDYAFRHGELHGREYRLSGHENVYGVVIDAVTSQKWGRLYDSFASEYKYQGAITTAYFRGMQNSRHGLEGIQNLTAVIKHIPGSGPAAGGINPHRYPGRWMNHYPGHTIVDGKPGVLNPNTSGVHIPRSATNTGSWPYYASMIDDALRPAMQQAYPLGAMPCYGIYADFMQHTTYATPGADATGGKWSGKHGNLPAGTIIRPGFETGSTLCYEFMIRLLREDMGWDGGIYTDWGVTLQQGYGHNNAFTIPGALCTVTDLQAAYDPITNPFGTGRGSALTTALRDTTISPPRFALTKAHALGQAGWDYWLNAYNAGSVSREWLEYAGAKHLETLFRMGMFENPYNKVGDYRDTREEGIVASKDAGRRALVLLKNGLATDTVGVLPLNAGAGGNAEGKTIYWDGVTTRGNTGGTSGTALFTAHGVVAANVLASAPSLTGNTAFAPVAAQATADIQIVRIKGRHSSYDGLNAGGSPVTLTCPVYQYQRWYNGHQSWLDYMQNVKHAAGYQNFSNATRLSDMLTNANVNLLGAMGQTYRPASLPLQTRGQARRLFSAISSKKEGSKLIVIVGSSRPFTFDSRFTGEVLTGADAGKGIQPNERRPGSPSHIREVSTIKNFRERGWSGGTYNGTNLYAPATDNVALGIAVGDQVGGVNGEGEPLATANFAKPTKLVELIEVGAFTRIGEASYEGGPRIGRVLYVDPVAARTALAASPLANDPDELRALHVLQWPEFNPGRWHSTDWITRTANGATGNVLTEVMFIDNPLDYIDALLVDFGGMPDDSLVSALFGRDGSATAAPFAPTGTMPFCIYQSNTQEEHTWEDIPNDLPGVTHLGKRGYVDYKGFLFGYRAGLVNHPTLPQTGAATSWQKGRASNQNNDAWMWSGADYAKRWD